MSHRPLGLSSHVLVCVALLGGVAASGCNRRPRGLRAEAAIVNPLTSGGESQHVLRIDDAQERELQLPSGVLTDEARIMSASDAEVCFDVVLRDLEQHFAQIGSFGVELTASNVDRLVEPALGQGPMVAQTAPGVRYVEEPTGGVHYECHSYASDGQTCLAGALVPTTRRVPYPSEYPIYESRSRVCYPNHGVLTADSEWMRLRLVDPANPRGGGASMFGGRRGRPALLFEWRFPR